MRHPAIPARLLLLGAAACAFAQPAQAASDPRRVVSAGPCTVTLKAGTGTIDIKVPTASGTLKTLWQGGDQSPLAGGQEYVFFFTESKEGLFSFDLQFAPAQGAPWSCRVKTIPDPPFIRVEPAGTVRASFSTDKARPLISIP